MNSFFLIIFNLAVSFAFANETTNSFWSWISGEESSPELKIVIDRSPKVQTLTVYEPNKPTKVFKVSTGREQFDIPTNPLRQPYCSTTPVGKFKPFQVSERHISGTWEDAVMPNAIFFQSGIAIHGTVTKEGVDHLGEPASGGCVRMTEDASRYVAGLVTAKKYAQVNTPVLDANGHNTWRLPRQNTNVSIEVKDSRTPDQIKKVENDCNEAKKFWKENCESDMKEWKATCGSTHLKEQAPFLKCLRDHSDHPEQRKNCTMSNDQKICLSEFNLFRDMCKSKMAKWQQSHGKNNDLVKHFSAAPLPPTRPSDLGKPATNDTLAPQPPARPSSIGSLGNAKNINAPTPVPRPSNLDVVQKTSKPRQGQKIQSAEVQPKKEAPAETQKTNAKDTDGLWQQ